MLCSVDKPNTKAVDANIQRHFLKVCELSDLLSHYEKSGVQALAAMPTSSTKKRKSSESLEKEVYHTCPSLHNTFLQECKILGMYLGRRLYERYSDAITSILAGNDGYAILELVPGVPSSFWTKTRKQTLLHLFWLELEPCLCSIEAIQPTFCQVNMRKVKESFLDGPNAPPLSTAFLKALNGTENSLFPSHIFQSYQLLQTVAGVPLPMPQQTKQNSKERFQKFQPNATVVLKRYQTALEKKRLVSTHFLEPVPHLVR